MVGAAETTWKMKDVLIWWYCKKIIEHWAVGFVFLCKYAFDVFSLYQCP